MKKCKFCGTILDAGEVCNCKNGTQMPEKTILTKRPLTSEELKRKLERMTHAEYMAYLSRSGVRLRG